MHSLTIKQNQISCPSVGPKWFFTNNFAFWLFLTLVDWSKVFCTYKRTRQKLISYWIFAGIRVQSFSYSGQIFQVKTLDCSSTKCDILEVSIASDKPEVLASTNNTLNLCIEDYSPNSASCQREYLESCCQFVTFFRPASTEIS